LKIIKISKIKHKQITEHYSFKYNKKLRLFSAN